MTAIQTTDPKMLARQEDTISITQIVQRLARIQELFDSVMKADVDYGVIPGTGGRKDAGGNPIPDRPSLLKPGAELICKLFSLSATYSKTRTDLPMNHREIEVVCTLTHIPTGDVWGQGIGVATTMESKHRYRGTGSTPTGETLSKQTIDAYWKARKGGDWKQASRVIGGDRFTLVKNPNTNQWEKHEKTAEKRENPDPADQYHTVMSMACKRALVAAVRTATACSRMFEAQLDDEDMALIGEPPEDDVRRVESTPTSKPADPKPAPDWKQAAVAHFSSQYKAGRTELEGVLGGKPIADWDEADRTKLNELREQLKSGMVEAADVFRFEAAEGGAE